MSVGNREPIVSVVIPRLYAGHTWLYERCGVRWLRPWMQSK